MDIEILKGEYSRKMEKALKRGDFALFDNLRRQYDRLLQTREQVTAKTITDTMSKEDKEKCNRLLRKIPVLADIAESSAVDLLSLLKKYDTEEVNVVYKRKGNTYGLIEPELD